MLDPIQFPVPAQLETRRLLLRVFAVDDAPELHEAIAESIHELRAHLWFIPWVAEEPTLDAARVRCQRALASHLLRTDLAYLAFDKERGRVVGSAGLHRTDWSLPKTEVGYWIRTSEVGKGYATEAVSRLTDWSIRVLGARRVELIAGEKNAGSRAVAEKCGYRLEGTLQNTMLRPDGALCHSCVYARLPGEA
jgi:RimJ/RimL family protein N-acetyltransferase